MSEAQKEFNEKQLEQIVKDINSHKKDNGLSFNFKPTKFYIPASEDNPLFNKLWRRFSEIQYATFLEIDKDSLARFQEWIITGDDERAWS